MRNRLPIVLLALVGVLAPTVAKAQSTSENAEARVYFEEGNRLYQEAGGEEGPQRTALLQRALGAYVDSLRIVRSRNALFNAAIVLGELERDDEAFNYFSEYLRVEGLSAADRDDATRRRDALRPKVGVLQVTTEPPSALLWVDRKDLAPRGETPIELALPAGDHRAFIELEGYAPLEQTQSIVEGETAVLALHLSPLPVEPAAPQPEPVLEPTP
ncbi:MAG: PEGA domain-containing protein, partial [Polyangiales bacterium]